MLMSAGGYAETESGLSKFPLHWMIEEAHAKGLLINRAMVNHLALSIRGRAAAMFMLRQMPPPNSMTR